MVFLTKFLPLFLLTNGSFLTTSSSSSISNASNKQDVHSIDSSASPASSSSSSQLNSSPISLSTHQNNSLLLLSASSSDRFVTVRKKKQDPDFSIKGGVKGGGGHRFTVTASTTVTTVSPLAITTASTSNNSSQSVTDSTTGLPGVSSGGVPSSTSISVAAVFESEARSNQNSPVSDVTDSNNLARDGFMSPSGSQLPGEGRSHSDESKARHNSNSDDREVCDFCIYQGEGNFTSYGYPLHYKPNLNCTYRIQRSTEMMSDVCELELIFHDFDIPVSSIGAARPASFDCKEDYLEVQGRRFCGSGWRDKMEVISFPLEQKELTFYFISNERVNGRGFWLEVRRRSDSCFDRSTLKSCEERFSDEDFFITSPRFPESYPNNADCTYFIRKYSAAVCALELTFLTFDIESVNGCFYDYLEIEGQKVCGNYLTNTKRTIDFRGDQKSFLFHTDKQVTRGGFNIKVTQVTDCHSNVLLPPPPSCNICTKEPTGTLVSYNYPDPYRNNLLCTYTIEKSSREMCSVELFFEDFDVLPSLDCMKDYLQISGQRFCGTTLHSTRKVVPFEAEDSLTLVFRTNDALSSKGFSLKYTQKNCPSGSNQIETAADKVASNNRPHQLLYRPNSASVASAAMTAGQSLPPGASSTSSAVSNSLSSHLLRGSSDPSATNAFAKKCDYLFTEKSFFLKSENYSQGNYPVDLDCSYYVAKNSTRVCYLELSFIRFDVEASAQCQFDYLEINNVRLCGSLAKETTRTYIFEGREKIIRFHSDASNTRSGYFIKVDQLECDGDVIVRSPPPLAVTPVVSTSTTTVAPARITNRDGQSHNGPSISCNQFFMAPQFEIRSPSYPRSYPTNVECIYYIKKSNSQVCRIEATYHEFILQSPDPTGLCKYDYLDFNGIRMCGSLNKGDIRLYYFPENEFKLKFSSDNQVNLDGKFRISLRQLDCHANSVHSSSLDASTTSSNSNGNINSNSNKLGQNVNQQQHQHQLISSTRDLPPATVNCDQVLDQVTFEIKSPGYPSSYPSDVNCRYTIHKVDTSGGDPICQLEVHFAEFVTPDGSTSASPSDRRQSADFSCKNDHLTFEGFGRVCGNVPSDTVKFFPFDGSTFTIDFHSDGNRENVNVFNGFHLKIRQRECLAPKSPVINQPPASGSFNQLTPGGPSPSDVASFSGKRDHLSLSSTQCGQMVSDLEFELKSPFYPSPYSENVECVYTIRKNHPSICNIELRFIEFDVEESSHCTKDYLLMDGKKFCGRYKPNTYMNFDFSSSNEKIIYFKSDSESSRRGFLLMGKQKTCEATSVSPPNSLPDSFVHLPSPRHPVLQIDNMPQRINSNSNGNNGYSSLYPGSSSSVFQLQSVPSICELCFTNTTGMITSYAFPRPYPPNLNCKYKITAMPGYCSLEVTFDTFNLPSDSDCSEDFLMLDTVKYCSTQLQGLTKQIPFKGSPGEVTLVFSTNSYNSGRGFKLLYTQIPCDSSGNRGLITGSAPSPSLPPSFTSGMHQGLNLGNSLSSSFDPSSSTSIASGSQISVIDATPIDHIRTNVAMGPSSVSISPGSPPTSATRVPCDLVIYDLFFEISSPGYPYGYPQSADCLYSIRRLNNRICSLVLHFIELDLSPSSGCQSDYLEIDGQRICSGILNDTKKEIDFHSYKVPIRFKTDSIGTRNKGFFLKGIQKECGYMAYSAASSPSQSIQVSADASQNRNSYYPSSSRFSPPYEQNSGSGHSIITVSGRAPPLPPVRIKEADFPPALSSSLFPPASNFGNSGEITSSFSSSSSSQSSPFSPSPAIISSSTSFTDGSRHHRNRLNPHFISPPPQFSVPGSLAHPSCDLVINETFFELKSLNYPSRYPSGSKCIYTIERATKNVCNLDLLFMTFDVGDATCLGDHVAIDGDKFCGIIPRERIQSFRFDSRSKVITFIGNHGQGHGFIIRGRQVECGEYSRGPSYLRSISAESLPPVNSNIDSLQTPPINERVPVIPFCDQTFTTNQFTIRSPNYPKDYPASLYCRYTIRRPSEAVCGLEFKLKTFDLEDSAKCIKDFLEIDTGKICGHLPANHERRYYYFSGENEKVITFRTDSSNSKSGFKIEVTQITNCNPHIESPVIAPTESLCDHTTSDIRGHISSLNFPNQYPDYVKCTYRIKPPNAHYCTVRLFLRDVDIQASPACDKDYLYIKGERICGHDLSPRELILPIPDHGPFREVTFNFITDASVTRRGFYIEFTQELCKTSLSEGISYSVVNSPSSSSSSSFSSSSSSSTSQVHPPISVVSLNSPTSKGSPEYPSNYVAKAQLEQIVEAQVTVLDSKDGLSVPAIQVSSVVSNDAISSNSSYPSLG